MRQSLVIILFVLFATHKMMAIDSPILQCISLTDNDDITLSWSTPSDTGVAFDAYNIYYSSGSNQNFTLIDQVTDYITTSTTIIGSFSGQGSFYIVTSSGGNESIANDTVSPLIISLFNDAKVVTITWQGLEGIQTDSIFSVYRRRQGETFWNFVGQTQFGVTTFKDTSDWCSATLEYKVEVNSSVGCVNTSNSPTKLVVDDRVPVTNNLLAASVDTTTGFVNVFWDLSPSPDVFGYRVIYYEEFTRQITSFGITPLQMTFDGFNINAQLQSEMLSIAPFDSCFDSVANWYNQAASGDTVQTLFIDSSGLDRCAGQIELSWNLPRGGRHVGVRYLHRFNVYRKIGNQAPELRGAVSPTDSSFLDTELKSGNKYTYVVTAVDTIHQLEALSNKLVFSLDAAKAPEVLYISSVKNNHETEQNEVILHTDSVSEVVTYRLFRTIDSTLEAQSVKLVEDKAKLRYIIRDETADAKELSYYYYVAAFDECDAFMAASNLVRSVCIYGEKDHKENISHVTWNDFLGFDSLGSGLGNYYLLRNSVTSGLTELLASKESFEYSDYLTGVEHLGGENCYYIEVVEQSVNQLGVLDTFRSNQVCFEFSPRTFFPNAFSPDGDGINDEFLPYANYISQQDYHLIIYDRTGVRVFETNDPTKGWDGLGQEIGVYVFVLNMTNAFGDPFSFTGKVHLIR